MPERSVRSLMFRVRVCSAVHVDRSTEVARLLMTRFGTRRRCSCVAAPCSRTPTQHTSTVTFRRAAHLLALDPSVRDPAPNEWLLLATFPPPSPATITVSSPRQFSTSPSSTSSPHQTQASADAVTAAMTESVQTITQTQGAAVPRRPSLVRTPSGSLKERRPYLQLVLTSTEHADFRAAVQESRSRLVSDAANLPKSTNMGLGKQAAPQAVVNGNAYTNAAAAPVQVNRFPIPQPIADNERVFLPTTRKQSGEEGTSSSRTPETPVESKAVFLRAIPCMYVANVLNATAFYKDILGFSVLGKPDPSHVSLVRSPPSPKGSPTDVKQRGTLKVAPPDSVQVYLRITPMGTDGQRVKPPPTTLWIQVNDVDEVHAELSSKWANFAPRVDEYFPMHSFGDAKILAKPQNKAWGTREMHLLDSDENKIIFFRDLH